MSCRVLAVLILLVLTPAFMASAPVPIHLMPKTPSARNTDGARNAPINVEQIETGWSVRGEMPEIQIIYGPDGGATIVWPKKEVDPVRLQEALRQLKNRSK